MPDLSATIVLGYGRQPVMPPVSSLFINLPQGEVPRLSEVVTRAITPLRPIVADEALHVVANTGSVIIGNTGQVAFNASPDHAVVTSYTARVRVSGSSTVTATQSLGKPTPDGNTVIIVDMSSTFAGLSAGNYTVSILATSPGGSTDSTESAPFVLPLA